MRVGSQLLGSAARCLRRWWQQNGWNLDWGCLASERYSSQHRQDHYQGSTLSVPIGAPLNCSELAQEAMEGKQSRQQPALNTYRTASLPPAAVHTIVAPTRLMSRLRQNKSSQA